MATAKGTKKGRGTATARAKATARGRSTSAKKAPVAKAKAPAKPKTVAKPKVAAKPIAKAAPAAAKRPAAKPAAAENAEVTSLKNKFQRERNGLEKRLTEAVREIGLLRHHELRAMQLERQVAERDAMIERLQAQLADLQRRPPEPVYVHEVQQSLALGAVASDDEADASGLDEFEEETLVDDGDLISDD